MYSCHLSPESSTKSFFSETARAKYCICGELMDEKKRKVLKDKSDEFMGDNYTDFLNSMKEAVISNIVEPDENHQELFEKQTEEFKKDILDTETLIVSIEAGSVASWHDIVGSKGITLGINKFGESAPYKEVYDHFNLSTLKIVAVIQERLRKV